LTEECEDAPPESYLGLWSGEIAGSALGAGFGESWVYVELGAELHVIAAATIIAKEWLARSCAAAFIAILHVGGERRECRSSPFGRNQMGANSPFV
jgi:hypothetical protein